MRVFISSPYAGDIESNVAKARQYCRDAVAKGVNPIAPHLFYPQFLEDKSPKERKAGLTLGLDLLSLCDEIWVYGQPSPGMQAEIALAEKHGIPIRHFKEETR